MGVLVRTIIVIFLGLFTLASLAEIPPRPKPKKLLNSIPRKTKKVDLTLNRQRGQVVQVEKGRGRKRLFDWIKMRWVDIGDWDATKKLFEGDEDSAKNKDAAGTGMGSSSSGKTSSVGSGKSKGVGFGYDENAAKTPATTPEKPTADQNGDGDGGGGQPPRTPPGGPPPANEGRSFPDWWPVCIFIPPEVKNGNEIVKTLVDMSGRCNVNIVPFPIAIKSLAQPDEPDYINAQSRAMCNVHQAMGKPDVSSIVATPSSIAADLMCGTPRDDAIRNPQTAGCAEVRAGGGAGVAQRIAQRSGNETLQMGNGGALVSIIDRQGLDGRTASHEGIGHNQMGWPNGKSAGNGIGDPNEPWTGEGGSSEWTDVGCKQMRDRAYHDNNNRFKWLPEQQVYFVDIPPDRRWPVGKPLYGGPPPVAGPPPAPPTAPPAAPPVVVRGDPPPSQLDPDFGKPSGPPADANPPPGHRKPGGGSGLVSLRNGDAGVPSVPSATGKGETKGYGYDESNAKVPAGDSTAILDPLSPGVGKPGATKGYGYDESNVKTASGGTASGSESGGGTAGKPGETAGGDASKGENPTGGSGSGDSRRTPASILNDVKAMAAELDDDFFNKVKLGRQKDERKKRGDALRQSPRPGKPVY